MWYELLLILVMEWLTIIKKGEIPFSSMNIMWVDRKSVKGLLIFQLF